MVDLRNAGEFWEAYRECGETDTGVSNKYGVSRSTIKEWRRHHEQGRVFQRGAWIVPGEVSSDGSDVLERIAEWLVTRCVPIAPPPTAALKQGEYATCLVFSDLHFPHHHEAAFEVLLGLAETIQPTEIVADGDLFDFSQISKYVRDPTQYVPMLADIKACQELLARIEAASPSSVRRFITGNHEEARWKNYLFTRCPEIADFPQLTMEVVLGLTEMGWVWQPFEHWVTDQLIIYHGDRHSNVLGGGSAISARKEMLDMGCSGVTGHTHHAGAFFRQDRTGYRVWHEIGCLCDWRKMQAAGVTTRRTPTKAEDWALCCALIRYRPGHSAFRVELIPIIDDGRRTFCIWQDMEIAA